MAADRGRTTGTPHMDALQPTGQPSPSLASPFPTARPVAAEIARFTSAASTVPPSRIARSSGRRPWRLAPSPCARVHPRIVDGRPCSRPGDRGQLDRPGICAHQSAMAGGEASTCHVRPVRQLKQFVGPHARSVRRARTARSKAEHSLHARSLTAECRTEAESSYCPRAGGRYDTAD